MKHVTFADKSLLMDDETADALVRYAAVLASHGQADDVEVNAYGSDGDSVMATMLLSQGASLMAETASSDLPGPDNSSLLAYIEEHLSRLESPARPMEDEDPNLSQLQDYDF